MPAELQFFDMEANLPAAQNVDQPIPITLGPNWQPGDIRVFYQFFYQPAWQYSVFFWQSSTGWVDYTPIALKFGPNVLSNPPGFNALVYTATSGATPSSGGSSSKNNRARTTSGSGSAQGGSSGVTLSTSVAWRRLKSGDVDTFISYGLPAAMNVLATVLFTVRGVDPSWNPLRSNHDWGFLKNPSTTTVNSFTSVTVPDSGTMVYLCTSYPDPTPDPTDTPWNPAQYTGFSIGAPDGWTNLVATNGSGNTFYEFNSNPSSIAVAKSYASATSTGTVVFQAGSNQNPECSGMYLWLQPAADVSALTGNASTTSSATAATYSSALDVVASTGSASTVSAASTAFNRQLGYWISDPLVLTGAPVTGSAVRWTADTPGGTLVTVETSINNGASWDVATNDLSIPRLREGDTTTQFVLARITLSQTSPPTLFPSPSRFPSSSLYPSGSPPRVTSFQLSVSTDASVDELVPIGFGMIDEVTTHATGGTTGAGSSTNVAGSTAVIGRGGGQTGGGTAIKIHVNDLSYAIKRNVWQQPYTVPSGLLYTDAIKAMVLDRLPDQTAFNLATTTRITPLLVYGVQQGGDPWQDIQELAAAIGFEAFFDATGTFVCRPVPDPSTGEPVWQFDETANPVVAEASRDLSSDQTFNDIVVVGQSTSTENPFSAEAYDDNPSSPTYILGPYGRVAQRVTMSLITSQDQAQDAANAALYYSMGAADTVTLTVVPQPALEPGDVVKVVCSDVKANGTYVVNSMTTPLSPADPQTLTCFRQSSLTNLGQATGPVPVPPPPAGTIFTSIPMQLISTDVETSSPVTTSWPDVLTSRVGNCLVVWATIISDGVSDPLHYASISGGGVTTWHQVGSMIDQIQPAGSTYSGVGLTQTVWFGVVTSPGSNTITLNPTGSDSSSGFSFTGSWVAAQEFTVVGVNNTTTWGIDGNQQGTTSGNSSVVNFPTVTPSGAGELYVGGITSSAGVMSTGSQVSGVSGQIAEFFQMHMRLPVSGRLYTAFLYNPTLPAGTQTPSVTQAPFNYGLAYSAVGGVIKPTGYDTT